MHNEIQDVLGQSFAVPDGLDEDDLLEELEGLEDEMANELESGNRAGVPSYLQVWGPTPCLTGLCSLSSIVKRGLHHSEIVEDFDMWEGDQRVSAGQIIANMPSCRFCRTHFPSSGLVEEQLEAEIFLVIYYCVRSTLRHFGIAGQSSRSARCPTCTARSWSAPRDRRVWLASSSAEELDPFQMCRKIVTESNN